MWANFFGTNFPKSLTVDSKTLKRPNIWQNLVGLGSLAFVWELGSLAMTEKAEFS